MKRKKKTIKKETSKKTESRIPSGIEGFDRLVEGGFKKDSINLVSGGPGSGKTIFALQFLINGIKKFGENSLYITFEEKKERLFDDVKEFGWDLEELEKQKKFIFLEYTPEQVKELLVEGGGIVENIVEKNKISRIVIDSISSFALLYKDELTKKEASLALFELINSWNATALLTSQDKSAEEGSISAALEFEVDSIVLLYHTKIKGERVRALEILKMRGTKHSGSVYQIDISSKGLSVSTNKKLNI